MFYVVENMWLFLLNVSGVTKEKIDSMFMRLRGDSVGLRMAIAAVQNMWPSAFG